MTNGAALDPAAVRAAAVRLRSAGVRTVVGTTVNAAGLTLAKSVPVARLDAFAAAGMGASPVWHAFCVDAAIAFTDAITAVGDLRLRLDADSVRDLGGGIAGVWSTTTSRTEHPILVVPVDFSVQWCDASRPNG